MLPYEDEKKLENLLKQLFVGVDGSAAEDVVILGRPIPPEPFNSCCSLNYGSYED